MDLEGDNNLDVLVYTTDGSKYYLYKESFNNGDFSLETPAIENLAKSSIYDNYHSSYPTANITPPVLEYSSVLGRLPVFNIDINTEKKYGDLYHFAEDTVTPTIELEELVNNPKTRERDLQVFFNRNQDFILNDEYRYAHSGADPAMSR